MKNTVKNNRFKPGFPFKLRDPFWRVLREGGHKVVRSRKVYTRKQKHKDDRRT